MKRSIKYPISPEHYNQQVERLLDMPKAARIPALVVFSCICVIKSYYGGYFKAARVLLWYGIHFWTHHIYWSAVYAICDKVGWTRLYPLKAFPGHFERHGRNCQDVENCCRNCVDGAVPLWYRKMTFWGDTSPEKQKENN